jgi:diguanylate cyclase (GGDEF)-like protein
MAITVVGSVAFDTVETPAGRIDRCLAGAATYFSLAASYFTSVRVIGVVGEDFTAKEEAVFAARNIDIRGIERAPGKSFFWQGSYLDNLNEARTLQTDLNVFASFNPQIPEAQELLTPDGESLGYLLATPLLRTGPDSDTSAALLTGARLAELAIDTRRLYSDLRRRSEYDLLTDIPNRFSMERQLDLALQEAGRNAAILGLIYVDLDRFKQVNDQYGHRTGDLYLQEVTRRMKLQLRSGDVLARIGGDEFIALVPVLRSRADADEIALRIERCFDDPFRIEGYELHGSASVGLAVYPQDGTTKEELQRSADAAMYAHKQLRRDVLATELQHADGKQPA